MLYSVELRSHQTKQGVVAHLFRGCKYRTKFRIGKNISIYRRSGLGGNWCWGEKVTIFVGDNGTGKSTLLEAIAYGLDLPLIDGRIGKASPSFEAAKAIRPYLEFQWKREVQKGFFFRAEDFSHFIDDADRERENMHYAGHR